MKIAPLLKTARLTLRGIEEEDTGFILKLRSDPEVFQYFVSPYKITEAEHIKWFRNSYLKNENRIDWVATDSLGKLVGIFGVKRNSNDTDEAEVSYILATDQYGKGLASEAVGRLIRYCAEEWQCKYVTAEIHKDNSASIRFAEKLGFVQKSQSVVFIFFRKKT